MPFQNRVTPDGDLIAVPDRGTLTGNRGVLHDAAGAIVRRSQVRRWITCVLAFRGRHREVMTPGRYTHLFFLDEATAFAAGHRPCAECRYPDYQRFRHAWSIGASTGTSTGTSAAPGPGAAPTADALDAVLAAERALVGGRRRTRPTPSADLPDGAFVVHDGTAWLVAGGRLARWTPGGYVDRRPRPAGELAALTPPSTLAAFRAGYRVAVHPSGTG